MREKQQWSEQAFLTSATRRGFGCTAYVESWRNCEQSAELRSIFDEEVALQYVPEWAIDIVDRMLSSPLAPCGHYSFPTPVLQVCKAIGEERAPDFVIGCYTADSARKTLLSYYIFCLDAWLKEAPLSIASAELARRDSLGKDWGQVLQNIYQTLGERDPIKRLLIERLLHRLRWWVKTHTWEGDRRDRFMLDSYLGDVRGRGDWGEFGEEGLEDPYFTEMEEAEVRRLEQEIRQRVPGSKDLLTRIQETWLCAPKAFRYLERVIIEIGSMGTTEKPDLSRSVLQCEDTYPDLAAHRRWYDSFMMALEAWLAGRTEAIPALGEVTPVKHWLVRMLRHRLELMSQWTRFVAGIPQGRSGLGAVTGGNETYGRKSAVRGNEGNSGD